MTAAKTFSKLFLLLIAVVATLLTIQVMQAMLNNHMLKGDHAKESVAVVQFMNLCPRDKMLKIWINPTDNYKSMSLCGVPGDYGVYIEDKEGNPVTATPKDGYNSLDAIVGYMRKMGYKPISELTRGELKNLPELVAKRILEGYYK